MHASPPDRPGTAAVNRLAFFLQMLCWAGGVAGLLAFFFNDWNLPTPWGSVGLHPWRGHLIIETLIATGLFLLGALASGWWWSAVRPAVSPVALGAGAWFIFLWSVAALVGGVTRSAFMVGAGLWLSVAFAATIWDWRSQWARVKAFLTTRRRWNVIFFVLWVLMNVAADMALLPSSPGGFGASLDCVLGRLLNHLFVAAVVWYLLAWHDRWVPGMVRWTGWVIVVLMPLFVLIDTILRLAWTKGLITLFGELEVGGRFEFHRALVAGGVEVGPLTIGLAVAAVAAAVAVFWVCAWISRRMGAMISPLGLIVIGSLAWTAFQMEQGAGVLWKSRAWRWWEMKTYRLRMTPFIPPPGIASFRSDFADPKGGAAESVTFSRRPDIFFFVVETLRNDALRAETTPFLWRWRDEECQPLQQTWAASNATHLSWFSMFSGRLPVFWDDGRQRGGAALLPATLRRGGYRVEARMVSDFDYMEMLRTNFGQPHQIDLLEYLNESSREHIFKTPEREVRMLDRVRTSVQGRPAGGGFWITAFDSPHYPYKWGDGFEPPVTDYEKDPMFPVQPSADEVRGILHRYWNSVAWVDRQLEGFMAFLKAQNRYDDAIIIVTGDHGEEFKEQGSWFHCSALNPMQTNVPILIKWPKNMGRGPLVKQASHLDLLPSLFDAVGMEEKTWADLPGQSLLHPQDRSIVITTHYAGKNGEAMLLLRDGWQAAFGWDHFWQPIVPQKLWLERIEGPQGSASQQAPETFLPLMRQQFPDVFGRIFKTLEAD
jgi:hypothetical protein